MDLHQPAVLIFAAEGHLEALTRVGSTAVEIARSLADSERKRRAAFATRLARSADAYIVRRDCETAAGSNANYGRTIIAGYPWFTDWGRDTFIARARPVSGRQTVARRGARFSATGLTRSRRACFPTASRIRRVRRNTIRSTRRCGTSSRSVTSSSAARPMGPLPRRISPKNLRGRSSHSHRLLSRNSLRHPL